MLVTLLACGMLILADPKTPTVAAGSVDFNRDIRPILTTNCLKCHGSIRQKGGLRLDTREGALGETDSGTPAIVPQTSGESELISRVDSDDEESRMPPKSAGPPLAPRQIELLKAWIDQGANWREHWAYIKPTRPAVPAVKRGVCVRNPIDHFVLAQLEKEGFSPNPEADRYTLVRRVYLDLIGLPPTLTEADAFLNDTSPDAYAHLVDRLLASPAFGERWARLWLDLARYADTQGYEKDNRRTIWRYRDWVIGALNRNMPFDQFTLAQMAGDLLPNRTTDQLIATAFHRNTMTNTEGGTDDEEFRSAAVIDRVNTTIQVWMGVTIGCTQCHNHPYEPIAHAEYYRLFAFFNNTEDNDQPDESPTIETPTVEQEAKRRPLAAAISELERKLAADTPELAAERREWEAGVRKTAEWRTVRPTTLVAESGATLTVLPDGSIRVGGVCPPNDAYTLTIPWESPTLAAVRLEAIPDDSLPKNGPGRAPDGNFVLSRISLAAGAKAEQSIALSTAVADFSQKDFAVMKAIGGDLKKTGWAIGPEVGKPHTAVFALRAVPANTELREIVVKLEHRYENPQFALGRFRIALTGDANALRRFSLPAEILTIVDAPPEKRTPAHQVELAKYHRSIAPSLAPTRHQLATLRKQLEALNIPTTPILRELPSDKIRTTHVFVRGSFLTKGEQVTAGVPKLFHALPASTPMNRIGFARWLVDRNNPLTARVLVNRLWEQLFGRGIVETSEDFGSQGEPPTHPELLDWLAVEMIDKGWDLKAVLRTMVTSATYRQSSAATPEQLKKDPTNRLWARGPRFRLEAEMVRDQSLTVSGLLSRQLYGPSVMPPQPDGVWQVVYSGDQWKTSSGPDKYRRGLYTFWRRTSPHPAMVAFDAPSREYCYIRRLRTNTPLQALVTLNDPAQVEAAQALARNTMQHGGTDVAARIAYAFRSCLVRPPQQSERKRLVSLYETALVQFRSDAAAAKELATGALGPAPKSCDVAELAAWTVVANVLLNLDEVLCKG